MRLIRAVYHLTQHFPDEEKPGLCATLQRTVASIPTKVAEIHRHRGSDQSAAALSAAHATLRECSAYLDVAERLRMTSRWRFIRPQRRIRKVADRLAQLSDVDADKAHC